MTELRLGCREYTIHRSATEATRVHAKFHIPILPHKVEEIAEALKRVELYFAGQIVLVKAGDKPRCFYCGGLNDDDYKVCEYCGASG